MKWIVPALAVVFGIADPAMASPLDGADRHKNAELLLREAEKIESALPALSAGDGSRIAEERAAAVEASDMRRFFTLRESPEYTVWAVRQHMEPLLGALSSLVERRYDGKQSEVELWVLVAKQFSEGAFYFGLEQLDRIGLVDSPIRVLGDAPQAKFHAFRTNIHDNILLPYVQGRLPD